MTTALNTLPHVAIPLGVLCASAGVGTLGLVIICAGQDMAAAAIAVLWRVVTWR